MMGDLLENPLARSWIRNAGNIIVRSLLGALGVSGRKRR